MSTTREASEQVLPGPNFKPSLSEAALVKLFNFINRFVPWHKLPSYIGAINLDALRIELRANNLHDGYASGGAQGNQVNDPLTDKRYKDSRNSDGKFNSLELPLMGCAYMRFGRNFPRQLTPKPTEEELWNPNPRMISEEFMARKPGGFIPATTLNLLAAAWIQFQTHDWFNHETVCELNGCTMQEELRSSELISTYRVMRHTTSICRRATLGLMGQ
jgi:diadenosine tetraphosphatase ApaH/serine/threonine PP2A family protein phosphatase